MSLKYILSLIVPPDGKPHNRQWYAWTGFGIMSFWLFFFWSIGMAPDVFGAGFARSEETKFNTQMLLEARLTTAKQRQCLATDTESKVYWTDELRRLMHLYTEKLGDRYNEPPCNAILVTSSDNAD